jgi:hypothetical protein
MITDTVLLFKEHNINSGLSRSRDAYYFIRAIKEFIDSGVGATPGLGLTTEDDRPLTTEDDKVLGTQG